MIISQHNDNNYAMAVLEQKQKSKTRSRKKYLLRNQSWFHCQFWNSSGHLTDSLNDTLDRSMYCHSAWEHNCLKHSPSMHTWLLTFKSVSNFAILSFIWVVASPLTRFSLVPLVCTELFVWFNTKFPSGSRYKLIIYKWMQIDCNWTKNFKLDILYISSTIWLLSMSFTVPIIIAVHMHACMYRMYNLDRHVPKCSHLCEYENDNNYTLGMKMRARKKVVAISILPQKMASSMLMRWSGIRTILPIKNKAILEM